jgi:hypothetical protein
MAEETQSANRESSQASDDDDRESSQASDDHDRESSQASDDDRSGTEGGERAEQNISAPSLGPNTVIEREPVEERLARHEQSEVDAMGLDKRRTVVGEKVGPSKKRQLAVYLGFLAILAALAVGGIILVGSLDTSVGKDVPNSAPWAKQGAKQVQPKRIQ